MFGPSDLWGCSHRESSDSTPSGPERAPPIRQQGQSNQRPCRQFVTMRFRPSANRPAPSICPSGVIGELVGTIGECCPPDGASPGRCLRFFRGRWPEEPTRGVSHPLGVRNVGAEIGGPDQIGTLDQRVPFRSHTTSAMYWPHPHRHRRETDWHVPPERSAGSSRIGPSLTPFGRTLEIGRTPAM
jgi:hypothetical protein